MRYAVYKNEFIFIKGFDTRSEAKLHRDFLARTEDGSFSIKELNPGRPSKADIVREAGFVW